MGAVCSEKSDARHNTVHHTSVDTFTHWIVGIEESEPFDRVLPLYAYLKEGDATFVLEVTGYLGATLLQHCQACFPNE